MRAYPAYTRERILAEPSLSFFALYSQIDRLEAEEDGRLFEAVRYAFAEDATIYLDFLKGKIDNKPPDAFAENRRTAEQLKAQSVNNPHIRIVKKGQAGE